MVQFLPVLIGHHHRHHHDAPPPRYNGVRLAADIVGLVGTSLNILNPPRTVVVGPAVRVIPQPQVIVQPTQPVIVQQSGLREVWLRTIDENGRIKYQKVYVQD